MGADEATPCWPRYEGGGGSAASLGFNAWLRCVLALESGGESGASPSPSPRWLELYLTAVIEDNILPGGEFGGDTSALLGRALGALAAPQEGRASVALPALLKASHDASLTRHWHDTGTSRTRH